MPWPYTRHFMTLYFQCNLTIIITNSNKMHFLLFTMTYCTLWFPTFLLSFKNIYLFGMTDGFYFYTGIIMYNAGPRIHCYWLPKWPGIFDLVSCLCTMERSLSYSQELSFCPHPPFSFQFFTGLKQGYSYILVDILCMFSREATFDTANKKWTH